MTIKINKGQCYFIKILVGVRVCWCLRDERTTKCFKSISKLPAVNCINIVAYLCSYVSVENSL